MDIHEKIRKLLQDANMTPTQVAKALELKQPSVFSWCNGDSKPSKTSIMKLSKLFNVDPSYLLSESAAENGKNVAPELQKLLRGKHVVLYNKKSLTRFLRPVLCTAATTHCCMLAYAEYKHDWDSYHRHYRWHRLDDAYFEFSGQSGNINDCKLATFEIMTVWQQLMTNHKIRKKYGFIPFSEELLSWLKRIAVIFGVIVILFIAAIIIFR